MANNKLNYEWSPIGDDDAVKLDFKHKTGLGGQTDILLISSKSFGVRLGYAFWYKKGFNAHHEIRKAGEIIFVDAESLSEIKDVEAVLSLPKKYTATKIEPKPLDK